VPLTDYISMPRVQWQNKSLFRVSFTIITTMSAEWSLRLSDTLSYLVGMFIGGRDRDLLVRTDSLLAVSHSARCRWHTQSHSHQQCVTHDDSPIVAQCCVTISNFLLCLWQNVL